MHRVRFGSGTSPKQLGLSRRTFKRNSSTDSESLEREVASGIRDEAVVIDHKSRGLLTVIAVDIRALVDSTINSLDEWETTKIEAETVDRKIATRIEVDIDVGVVQNEISTSEVAISLRNCNCDVFACSRVLTDKLEVMV